MKLVIFDFWGTLVQNGVYSPVKQVKFILDIKEEFADYITKFEDVFMTKEHESLEDGFKAVIEAFRLEMREDDVDKLIGMWNKNTLLAKPFRDAIPVLEDLQRDYKLVLLCNTDNFSVKQVMDKYELDRYFDYVYLSCKEGKLKTDPGSFEKVLSEIGVSKEDAVMVGDSIESDMKGAEKAGVRGILLDRRDRRDFPDKVRNLDEIRSRLAD